MERAFNNIGQKCSLRGVLGMIIGYSEKFTTGGVVKFCTPHGTIIETGVIHLSKLTDKELIKLNEYEQDSLLKRKCLYNEEVVY